LKIIYDEFKKVGLFFEEFPEIKSKICSGPIIVAQKVFRICDLYSLCKTLSDALNVVIKPESSIEGGITWLFSLDAVEEGYKGIRMNLAGEYHIRHL
jgi:hypothetical protein